MNKTAHMHLRRRHVCRVLTGISESWFMAAVARGCHR